MRRSSLKLGVRAALTTAYAYFGLLSAFAQQAPRIGPEAYLDQEGYWPPTSRPVRVCWNSPEPRHEAQRRMVRSAVKEHIENQSGVEFNTSWPACGESDLGIRIAVSDHTWPVSHVGRQFARDPDGRLLRRFGHFGDYQELPTQMTLNFQLDEFAGFESCRGRNDECIAVVAIHEFLHSLGFLHEHIRQEAASRQPRCAQALHPPQDFHGFRPLRVGDYDESSIMNYCNNIYRGGAPRLSVGDLAALQLWYPRN